MRETRLATYPYPKVVSLAHQLAFVIGLAIMGGIMVFRDQILPEYFSFDSEKIRTAAQGTYYDDKSFDSIGAIYRTFGLANSPMLASIIGLSMFFVVLMVAFWGERSGTSWYTTVLFLMAAIVGAVYLATYSKDIFVTPLVAIVLISRQSKLWDVCAVLFMALFSYEVRTYWILVAALYILARFALSRNSRNPHLILLTAMAIVGVSLAIYFGTGNSPDYFRTSVNDARDLSIASNTLISPFVQWNEPYGGIANNILTAIAFVVPAPLLLMGQVYYLAIAVIFAFVWIAFLVHARRSIIFVDHLALHASKFEYVRTLRSRRCVALVLAFLSVQSLFEPDYGSVLRHLSPLLPLMLYSISTGRMVRNPKRVSGINTAAHFDMEAQ